MYVGWQSNLIFGSFCFDWIGHLVWRKRSGVGKFVGNLFWKMLVYWDEDCVYIYIEMSKAGNCARKIKI